MPKLPKLDAHDARRVAAEAVCDPRSVQKYLSGGTLRPTTTQRVRAALIKLGLV
jgi:hypothetical protein